tara:strand:+ start:51 stop:1664 length:1614 start_codon:yes stop_codon:yes gene_type:complete
MRNVLPNTTADFNLTNIYGDGDLDIGWAFIQVKRLLELSADDNITIAGETFNVKDSFVLRDAIQKMYDVNIAAGISQESQGDVYHPPMMLSSETYTRLWRINDIFEIGRSGKSPTESHNTIYESIEGERTGTITGDFTWARKNTSDLGYLKLSKDASISFDDKDILRFPYSISFSFYYESSGDLIFLRKGNFYLEIKNSYVHLKKTNSSKYNSFKLPNNLSHADLKNKWVEFRLIAVKTPDLSTGTANPEYKVFIDNVECENTKFSLNNVINGDDAKQPWIFNCNPITYLKNFRMSRSTVSYPDTAEDFAYDHPLDLESSFNYKLFENELIDNAGTQILITDFPGINNQHKAWYDKPATTNSVVGSPNVLKVIETGGGRKVTTQNIDISKDFTVSFWFRANTSSDGVVLFDAEDTQGNSFAVNLNTDAIDVKFPAKTYTYSSSINYTSDWTHLVAMKTGEIFSLYINGTLVMWKTAGPNVGTATEMDFVFGGLSSRSTRFYLSSLKILRYSIHHPEIVGWDNITTDNKIERLMSNNF